MTNQASLLSKETTTKQNRNWVRISAICNNKCIFCLDSDAQNGYFIEEQEIKEKIQNGLKPGMENRLILSGGEASINPKFSEYIRYGKELWYDRIQTITNGNKFVDYDFCKKVFDAWLQEVTFSMHGHTEKLHDYLVATPGAFKKSLQGIINIRKYFPQVILNIDIVVNKLNVRFLPDIVKFYMKLGVMEYDILQIIPFGRGFSEYKNELFYKLEEAMEPLRQTWELAHVPGMHMWTNRFPVEVFEGHEDLIQDPRKIKSEVMGEAREDFTRFIESAGKQKPQCFGERCDVCFLKQYCHDYLSHLGESLESGTKHILGKDGWTPDASKKYIVLQWEEFPSDVYATHGATPDAFIKSIQSLPLETNQKLVNVPKCIRAENNEGLYEWHADSKDGKKLEAYTKNYIKNLYRKKSMRCKSCIHNTQCEGIHINFIRSYGFEILQPIVSAQ